MKTNEATTKLSEQEKASNFLAVVSLAIYSFGIWTSTTNLGSLFIVDTDTIRRLCTFIALFLASFIVVFRYGRKILKERGFIAFAACLILLATVTLVSDNRLLLWVIVFILAFNGKVPLKSIVKAELCVLVVVGALTLFGFSIGAIPDSVLTDDISRGARHSFGFGHPNTLALYFFTVFLFLWPLIKRVDRRPTIVLFCLVSVGAYVIAGSRTFFGASLLLIFWFIISLRNSSHNKLCNRWAPSTAGILKKLFVVSLVCVFGSYAALLFYDGNVWFWSIADNVFSGRLSYAKQYLDIYGLSLFGQPVGGGELVLYSVPGQANAFLVDNLYDKMLLTYGILPTILLLVFYFYLTYQIVINDPNSYIGFCLVLFALLGVFESVGLRVDVNIFLLMLPMGFSLLKKQSDPRNLCPNSR